MRLQNHVQKNQHMDHFCKNEPMTIHITVDYIQQSILQLTRGNRKCQNKMTHLINTHKRRLFQLETNKVYRLMEKVNW